jgi:hypothetical protein
MILLEWDAQKETLENVRTPVCFRILSSSLTSVSIFSVCCYSIVSISVSILLPFRCLLYVYINSVLRLHWKNWQLLQLRTLPTDSDL